jgi:hypothetical protein
VGATAVKGAAVGRVERCAFAQAAGQVWVGDEGFAKSY